MFKSIKNTLKKKKRGIKMVNDLDYEDVKCHFSKKGYSRTEQKNDICTNVFCYENGLVYPVYVSHKKF